MYTTDILDRPVLRSSSSVTKKALRTLFHQTRVLEEGQVFKCREIFVRIS